MSKNVYHKPLWLPGIVFLFLFCSSRLWSQTSVAGTFQCCHVPNTPSSVNFTASSPVYNGNTATVNYTFQTIISTDCTPYAMYSTTFNFGDQTSAQVAPADVVSTGSGSITSLFTSSHTYTLPNVCANTVYTVAIQVSNELGTLVCGEAYTVNIPHPGTTFSVTATNSVCSSVQFSYSGPWPLLNGQWIYGDNTASALMSSPGPTTYAYPAPGTYTAYLTGEGIAPCIQSVQVQVDGLSAGFDYTVMNTCSPAAGLALSVQNYTSALSYSFQVNGGALIHAPAGTATVSTATGLTGGNNTLSLISSDGFCQSSSSQLVNIGNPAGYTIHVSNSGCQRYGFSYSGSPVIVDAQWAFGDGSLSPLLNTMMASTLHTYPGPGNYLVTLSGTGLEPCTIQTLVTVPDFTPPDFSYTLNNLCDVSAGVTLDISDYDGALNYQWQINGFYVGATGPSGTYTSALQNGDNTIKLIVTNTASSCVSSVNKLVTVGAPPATFSLYASQVCVGEALSVYGIAPGGGDYAWTIDGPNGLHPRNGMNPDYVFDQPGTYNVELSVTSTVTAQGQTSVCSNTYSLSLTVDEQPDAAFTTSSLTCNSSLTISPVQPGTFSSYTVSYGDGTVHTGGSVIHSADLIHQYAIAASHTVYPITLSLANGACTASHTSPMAILKNTSLQVSTPRANFCQGESTTIQASVHSTMPGMGSYTYSWAGPGGFSATSPSIQVTAGGLYQLTVTSTGTCPLVISGSQSVTEVTAPVVTVAQVAHISCGATSGSATLSLPHNAGQPGFLVNGQTVMPPPGAGSSFTHALSGLVKGHTNIVVASLLNPACVTVTYVTVTQTEPSVNLSVNQPTTCSPGLGSAGMSASPSGGTARWYHTDNYPAGTFSTGASVTGLAPGSYVLLYTDNHCEIVSPFSIVKPALNLSYQGGARTCTGAVTPMTIQAQYIPASLSSSYSYSIVSTTTTSTGSSGQFSLAPGSYTARVSSAGSCSAALAFQIATWPALKVDLGVTRHTCGNGGVVSTTASGGDGNYTYDWYWDGAQNTNTTYAQSLETLTATATISVTVKDGSGCSTAGVSHSVSVSPRQPIALYDCGGFGNGNATHTTACEISACVEGGTPGYLFEWYRHAEQSENVMWRFRYNDVGVFVASHGATEYPVTVPSVPGDVILLVLQDNRDKQGTTVAYPHWHFPGGAAPAEPIFNTEGSAQMSVDYGSSTDPDHYYSVIETVTFTALEFVASTSGPDGSPCSLENFETGDYMLKVTDALGCSETFSIGEIIIPEPATFSISFDYVWGMGRKPDPAPDVDIVLHENMIEAADALLDQASACAAQKTSQVKSFLTYDCNDPANLRDELDIVYTLQDHHYTLYYYDRAGRLTKTVPPQGVELLSENDIGLIKSYRNGSATPGTWPAPPHRMATTYEYNSFGQLISQNTPDGGATRFIYDSKNRLRFSQNAQQALSSAYSYTRYDHLGRIVEVGQSQLSGLNFASPGASANVAVADLMSFPQASVSGANHRQVTTTVYSASTGVTYYGLPQRYLQNRVSYTYIDEDPLVSGDEHYTYYSYDSHGNVEWLVQEDMGGLGRNYIAYAYDLVSGKVLQVRYNEKRSDRFFHRYTYDAENRLKHVETSRNGEVWDRDAAYSYYAHGPLKRSELGEDRVQGLDYLYTMQGWIKSVNAPRLSLADDPGGDNDPGYTGLPQNRSAADRFGMVLNYYSGDYATHHHNFLSSAGHYSLGAFSGSLGAAPALYNGNISGWIQSQLDATATGTLAPRADLFRYDLLNRIRESSSIEENVTAGTWTNLSGGSDAYRTEYTYDRNGNILNLVRLQEGGQVMDDLEYSYDDGAATAALNSNRLSKVRDVSTSTVSGRQDFQDEHDYSYDAIGNLIRETGKELLAVGTATQQALRSFTTEISWTVYGKIKAIEKQILGGSTLYKERLRFSYDAAGNRIRKDYWKDNPASPDGQEQPEEQTITYYVRDAQGNPMAVYKRHYDLGESRFRIDLEEQPIYGSDRVGQNTEKVMLAAASATNGLILPGDGTSHISEYQNWITSTGKSSLLPTAGPGNNDNLCQCKVLWLDNSGSNPNYNQVQTAVELLGIAHNGIAVAEDLQRRLQFYVVLAERYLGGKDACLVFDREGKLMAGSEDIAPADVSSKPLIVNLPGTSQYALITREAASQQATYHIIDMSQAGYGPVGNAGRVITVNKALEPGLAAGISHGKHFTAVEDHLSGQSIVYATRQEPDLTDNTLAQTSLLAYAFSGTVTPQAHVISGHHGCATTEEGQLQISPDGSKLGWWRYDQYLAGFAYKTGELHTIPLSAQRTSASGNATVQAISPAGNYGPGMFDFMANSRELLYSQRGVYKEGSASTQYDRNIWRYDPVSLSSIEINPNPSPLISYLFGEIKRGVDGNYYIPNMGEPSDQIHAYTGGGYDPYSYSSDAAYQLAGHLPTQVYKVFDNNSLITDFVRTVGNKAYELKDHLGNVRVVISDAKQIVDSDADNTVSSADNFVPEVLSYNDYYAFGMMMPGRNFNANQYRYGYNKGSEKDDEIYGLGNAYNTEFRILDTRLGRWMSIDPKASLMPGWSPYVAMNNNPVLLNDPNGDFIPLITGLVGAAAGAIYGVATGKSGKEIAALAAGGFVAGATLGVGTLAVAAAGGIAATSAAGAAYIMGGSAIVGGMLGNATEQAIKNNGSIDKNEVLVSGAYGIPDAVLGGAAGQVTKGVEKGLAKYFGSKLAEETSEGALKEFKKDIAADLREQGLGRRQANKAANQAVDRYKAALEEGFQATEIGVKVTGKAVDVTLSSVQAGTLDQVKDATQEKK
jgi:RHS repeat-associated protein